MKNPEAYPGYPTTLYNVDPLTVSVEEAYDIPTGPWELNNKNLPTVEQSLAFEEAGYKIDSFGRPLHPDFLKMVAERGVVSGKGRYWNWGPNRTADPIVITKTAQPRVLLIKRGDTGSWALPGGFVEDDDIDIAGAALRELGEESSLIITDEGQEIYTGVVADRRTTAHAWPETGAYLWQVDRQLPVKAADDAKDAKWFRVDQISHHLFGAHNFLIHEALKQATFEQKKPIADILAMPKNELEVEIIDAGHMAYDHYHVSDGESTLFVKEHVASRFDDAEREKHSRTYLQKEFATFEHVAEQGFRYIPDRVELVDDHLLAMDALKPEDGHHWRAPDGEKYDPYVRSILSGFDALEAVPIPRLPAYHEFIEKTHFTFWEEGWDVIDNDKAVEIVARIRELSTNWTKDQRQAAKKLIEDLPVIREHVRFINRDPELFMAHNDARQSNIAWHPEQGARFVDWSWADPAPHHTDHTMFLIDLLKSDKDVTPYLDVVNKDQAILLIGFWLAHSLWNTRDGSTTVREQQVASASAAWQLYNA